MLLLSYDLTLVSTKKNLKHLELLGKIQWHCQTLVQHVHLGAVVNKCSAN